MRVSDFPSIRASSYGRENPKCWSQIAPMGEKGVPPPPPCVIRSSEQKIKVMTGNLGPKLNFFSLTVDVGVKSKPFGYILSINCHSPFAVKTVTRCMD